MSGVPQLIDHVRRLVAELDDPHPVRLTELELLVLGHLADGRSYAEVGRRLGLAYDTIKGHVGSIYAKLHARNGAHAVAIGLCAGLLNIRLFNPHD